MDKVRQTFDGAVRVEDHGRGHHRASQGAPSHFVNARNEKGCY